MTSKGVGGSGGVLWTYFVVWVSLNTFLLCFFFICFTFLLTVLFFICFRFVFCFVYLFSGHILLFGLMLSASHML